MQTEQKSPVIGWGTIDVERFGGLAGYGGSRLRSLGHILASDLSVCDQTTLYALFLRPVETPAWMRDAFHYHLSWCSDCGPQSMVIPEAAAPEAIKNCVHDELLPP